MKYFKWTSTFLPLAFLVFINGCVSLKKNDVVISDSNDAESELSTQPLQLFQLRDNEVKVTYFNVATGMCQLVDCPGQDNRSYLVDCGTTATIDKAAVIAKIQSRLANRKVNVVISHKDMDHHSLIPHIFPVGSQIVIESLWYGGSLADYDNTETQAFITRIRNTSSHSVNNGQPDELPALNLNAKVKGFHTPIDKNDPQPLKQCGSLPNNKDFYPSILAANTQSVSGNPNPNTQSIVLQINYGGVAFVFPGDATKQTEKFAIAKFPTRQNTSTVLSSSHHGANTSGSNSIEWAKYIVPSVVVYNAGENNGFKHPKCNVVDRYSEDNKELLSTNQHTMKCGNNIGFEQRTLTQAQYKTYDQGDITVFANQNGIVKIECEKPGEMGCGLTDAEL